MGEEAGVAGVDRGVEGGAAADAELAWSSSIGRVYSPSSQVWNRDGEVVKNEGGGSPESSAGAASMDQGWNEGDDAISKSKGSISRGYPVSFKGGAKERGSFPSKGWL